MNPPDGTEYWEAKYQSQTQVWSGSPTPALVDAISGVCPGRALDLGCGEGADSIWLAGRGWRVTAVDVSPTALRRGADEAARQSLPVHRISWQQGDLLEWRPTGDFDLVASSYLHPTHALSRYTLLRRFAEAVRPGGLFFTVAHATFTDGRELPQHLQDVGHSPETELLRLRLESDSWQVLTCERTPRASGEDNLLVLRRLTSAA